jgi:carboxyl-terminal processing protease
MLESLDPYTIYIPESKIEDMKFLTTGEYGGIGVAVIKRDEKVIIATIQENSPAEEQGLLAGDEILSVDDQDLSEKTDEEINILLKGQPGTPTKVCIKRMGVEEVIDKQVLRRKLDVDNIPYYGMLDSTVGYINLMSFTKNAAEKTTKAFNELKDQNAKALIFDLRGNGGGLIGEAVDILNLFIEKDTEVVRTKSRLREKNYVYRTRRAAKDTEIPIVVLVDKNSASASEIVSGAIQDLDRGVILGERTFGKGLVQNVIPLSFNSQFKVTIAKYYIPSGRCIQAIDYAHKDGEGNAHLVNDSLLEEFTTKNGRKVYDGRGVKPDVLMSPSEYSEFTSNLIEKFIIFDFATKFRLENDSIISPDQFEINDRMWSDFVEYLGTVDISYQSDLERKLEVMREELKENGLYEQLEEVCENIESEIATKKENELSENASEIKRILKTDLVSRYYYGKGVIIANLYQDRAIKRAMELLNNQSEYKELLQAINEAQ